MHRCFAILATLVLAACGAPGGGDGKGNGSVPRSDLPLDADTTNAAAGPVDLNGSSTTLPTGSPATNAH